MCGEEGGCHFSGSPGERRNVGGGDGRHLWRRWTGVCGVCECQAEECKCGCGLCGRR